MPLSELLGCVFCRHPGKCHRPASERNDVLFALSQTALLYLMLPMGNPEHEAQSCVSGARDLAFNVSSISQLAGHA